MLVSLSDVALSISSLGLLLGLHEIKLWEALSTVLSTLHPQALASINC